MNGPLEKDDDGSPLFSPEEYLDAAQINSLLYNFTQLDHKKIARQLQKVEKFKGKKGKKGKGKRKLPTNLLGHTVQVKKQKTNSEQVFEINVPVEVVTEESTSDSIVSTRGIKVEAWQEVTVEADIEDVDIENSLVKKENIN